MSQTARVRSAPFGSTFFEDPGYRGELMLEERVGFLGTDKLPLLRTASIVSLALGIRSYMELILASIAIAISFFAGAAYAPDGIDSAISALSGVQSARGQYKTVALPAIVGLVEMFHEYQKSNLVSYRTGASLAIYVLSYALVFLKVIK